jgi:tRNA(Ile)-lysidine synthase
MNFHKIDFQGVFDKLAVWSQEFGAEFVLGLSGGGDSSALLYICHEWLKTPYAQSLNAKVHPIIIDHNIAKNSATVAQVAMLLARRLGFDAKILKINSKIETSIQENARNLRYDLLKQAAFELGSNNILLAHNYGDNIETILFRMARQSDIFGLGAMRDIKLYEHQGQVGHLLRPVLELTRAELRQICKDNHIEYYDDPANDSLSYSRVKLRKRLEAGDIDAKKLLNIATQSQKIREYYEIVCFAFIVNHVRVLDNHVTINLKTLQWHSNEMQIFIIAKLLQILGNSPYSPQRKKIDILIAAMKTGLKGVNLHHFNIKSRKGTIIISPEGIRKNQPQPQIKPIEAKSLIQKAMVMCNIVPFS